ncbi:hypothetical protein IWX63_002526 [Arthrobacter sp. CAN_A2]|uniref:hypothetical protein n=1 Tax=Arthrobacter sp. CAN_A2 TaxID=2787718 RepID=UPI0018F037F9
MEAVLAQNSDGLTLWTQRRTRTDALLAKHATNSETQRTLTELRGVASTMEPMFRTRTERLGERVAVVRRRSDEIEESLNDLARSKLKLETSRMLSRERENLRKAMTDVSGTLEQPVAADIDPGVREDLNATHEAIILAEALLEVKAN